MRRTTVRPARVQRSIQASAAAPAGSVMVDQDDQLLDIRERRQLAKQIAAHGRPSGLQECAAMEHAGRRREHGFETFTDHQV